MFYEYKGIRPVVDETAFVHPQACVIGDVTIGKHVYIGPGAAIRLTLGKLLLRMDAMYKRTAPYICFPASR
jgi:phenylacetic acid degradation protein